MKVLKFTHILIYPETDSGSRIPVKVVYMEGKPRKHEEQDEEVRKTRKE